MLSVIVPSYNEEEVVEDCLRSLENQKGVQFEVLIVDDGSDDHTLKILKKFHTKKFSLKIIRQNHKGAGAARNKGVIRAKGNILVFLDADMTFSSDFLRELTKPILDGTSKGTFSKEEFVSNWDNVWARCWSINEGWEKKRRHSANHPVKQKVFRAIKKNEFASVGGFTEGGYTDDWSLSVKLGYLADEAPGAVFYHKNPASLAEIWKHAKWVGKRKYKLGIIGALFALIRASLPAALLMGIYKTIRFREPAFVIFKLVYNTALSWGIIVYTLTRKGAK